MGYGKEVRVMVMDIVGVREPIKNGMRNAFHASNIRVRVRDGVRGRVRVMGRVIVIVRVWDRVRVMEGLVGVRVGLGDQSEKVYA